MCYISLESSRRRLQLFCNLHLNQRIAQKVMSFQSRKSPNFGTPNLGVPRQNDICVQAPWLGTKNTIRERWWLLPSPSHGESCESVFARDLSMHQRCSNHALTNFLFGLCKFMWIIDSLVTHHSPHPRASACSFTFKVLRARERTSTHYPFIVFHLGFTVESIKELGGASYLEWKLIFLFVKISPG